MADLDIELPSHGHDGFRLEHVPSGVSVVVRLEDAPQGEMVMDDSTAWYRDDHGGEMALRLLENGVEDFVVAHAGEEVRYQIDVSRAAGLRLVGGTLELLDAGGAPRLRATRAYVVDSEGRQRPAELVLEDCHADRDPRGPWGRPVVPAGADTCTLVVRWDGRGLVYPLLVDPLWSMTMGSLTTHRSAHFAVALGNGEVLVGGGLLLGPMEQRAELYHPESGTFSPTGALTCERQFSAAVLLQDGDVLVTGSLVAECQGSLLYEPDKGEFRATTGMPGLPRLVDTLTVLPNGDVAVIGSRSEIEIYDPQTEGWRVHDARLKHLRGHHTATLLDDGRVLIAGGWGPMASTEIFDPNDTVTKEADDLNAERGFHLAAELPDGKVMVIGGAHNDSAKKMGMPTTEIYDPENDRWDPGPELAKARYGHMIALLPSAEAPESDALSAIVVAGGTEDELDEDKTLASVEILGNDNLWYEVESMHMPRVLARAAGLKDGRTLVTGGVGTDYSLTTAELLGAKEVGEPCAVGGECRSTYCSAVGVCVEDCGPYAIKARCLTTCESSEDCDEGFVCDEHNQCIEPPVLVSSCACEMVRERPDALRGLLAVALVALVRRRRAK